MEHFEEMLDEFAPLSPAPLCPEVQVFQARSLVEVWEALDRLEGRPTPSPFFAYAWPGGAALGRVLLDRPELVAGKRVIDVGCGGGVVALAAATAGAAHVVANDIDPRALLATRIAARRQGLDIATLPDDLVKDPATIADYDVVLCADLAYERSAAPGLAALLRTAREAGVEVLVSDAGRQYFDPPDTEPLASFEVDVPRDLEGVGRRTAAVYRLT